MIDVEKDFVQNFVHDMLDVDTRKLASRMLDVASPNNFDWVITISRMKRVANEYCVQYRLGHPGVKVFNKLMMNNGIYKKTVGITVTEKSIIDTKTRKHPTRRTTVCCWIGCKLKRTDGKLKIN